MVNMTNIEIEYAEYEENNLWREKYHEIRNSDDIFNLSCNHAKSSLNSKYNRYRDILPYDHSRVKLKNINETDYINANFVKCELANRNYILAQGPLRNTCEHFWQMIWEQNTKGIIMLNRLYEKGALKCEMYFPNVDEEDSELTLEFGKFKLNYLSEKPFQDFSIRTIECENLEQKEKRIVYHCHFTNWPDFGEPEYTNTFLKFLNECNNLELFNDPNSPSIVHCSAGVGRSGTFILVDSMLQLYKQHGNQIPISVLNLLKEFRRYRMGLVQTHQQFKFAFMAIIDGIRQKRDANNLSLLIDTEQIDLNIKNENDFESDSDSDDNDDFYENENTQNKKSNRPDTAKNGKRYKSSEKSKNHVKKLREIQFKNKQNNQKEENFKLDDVNIKTAVNRNRLEHESDELDDIDVNDDDEEEAPFASNRRDVETVKVNQPRKPIEQLKLNLVQEIKKENLELNLSDQNGSINQNQSKEKHLSEKEKRVSSLVNSMREKQIKHEQKKKFFTELRPYLIGGTILFGAIAIHQLYKNFFTR